MLAVRSSVESSQERNDEKTRLVSQRARPPLKWAGGKRWLVDRLRVLRKPFEDRCLVEPFCGGLSVALGLSPQRALLNDINPHAINFYTWLKKGLSVSIDIGNDKALFYRNRERFNECIRCGQENTSEAAQLFYYLNRTCFNGLCRFNKQGEYNVPFGRYKTIRYETDFSQFVDLLSRWEFLSMDFAQLAMDANAFIYADPPYDVEFTNYSKEGFNWQDQVRLIHWLDAHRGPVVVSNQATERVLALYRDFGYTLEFVDAPRRISCNGDRSKAREVLAYKGL